MERRVVLAAALLLCCVSAFTERRQKDASLRISNLTATSELKKVETPQIFPVPTSSRCIVIIVVQYMITYTCLALCRGYQEFTGTSKSQIEEGLLAAAQTLMYGPMICVLFIACRMRVEFLSDGREQPQEWVQHCMYATTFAVLASALLVLILPLVVGRPVRLREGSCDLEQPSATGIDGKMLYYVLSTLRYIILLGLYGGVAGVIIGICTYLPPGETDVTKLPAPAPAVMCTMILTVVFFVTQLVIAACRTCAEITQVEFPKTTGIMLGAGASVEFAPMLSILFLAARMRALQHDAQPQSWAQQCMFAATTAMCMTAFLAILVPLTAGGEMPESPREARYSNFQIPSPALFYILIALRFTCMFLFYGGVAGVIYSIFVFVAPAGPEFTLPVSPTVQCVVNLTCQFFFVYFVVIVCQTLSEVSGGNCTTNNSKFYTAVNGARATLGFAPMLSILFVTTRMYALLITDQQGAPQAWVQDGMYMATWSLFISFWCCLATGFVMDSVQTDADGNVVNKFSNKYVAIAMTLVRCFSILLLYGGIITVVVGLFVMTPETANGRGSVPLVSDAVDATPVGNAPPGPNDAVAAGSSMRHAVSSLS